MSVNRGAITVGLAGFLAMAAIGCTDRIRLDWTYEIGARSVSTPLVTEEYIAFGSGIGIGILELDGSSRCIFDAFSEVISAPKTDGNFIFFGTTNYKLVAIDTSCQKKWEYLARDRIKSDPLVAGGKVVTTSYDGHIYATDAKSGELAWVFPPWEAPIVVEPAEPPADPKKRKKKKRTEAEVEPAPPPKPVIPDAFSYSSPILHEGVIYVGNFDGYLYAIDLDTGAFRWRFRTDGKITSTPFVDGHMIYFGSNDGSVYAVDLREPETIPLDQHPRFPDADQPRFLKWKLKTKEWVNSSPRVVDGVLYIGGNDRNIYALDAAKGEVKWKFGTKGPAVPIPAVYKNLIIGAGGAGDGTIYALQAADGSLFWTYITGGKVESDPVIVGDRLYVTSSDQSLYAFTIVRTTAE